MTNMRMLIDTDAGVDDILAIFVAAQIARHWSLDLAVTFGNVPINQALENIAVFDAVSGFAPQRLFMGSSSPLLGEPQFAFDVHGADGVGGNSKFLGRTPDKPATDDLFKDVKLSEYNKIVALGPLTDISRLSEKVPSPPPLFVMGGAFDVPGNVSPFAEFNFYADPNAAFDVFNHYQGDVFVVPLDVCRLVVLGRSYLTELCDRNGSRATLFLKLIHQHYMDFYRRLENIDGCYPHDALCAIAAIDDSMFWWDRGRVQITRDGPERGKSLFCREPSGQHYVARDVDASRFFALLEDAISSYREHPYLLK
jgi:inosine-uridine nucleoside N-ribohydrolase